MIYLIGMAYDAWEDADYDPLYEVGYFASEAEALAWIDSGDYLQGMYDEEVARNDELNAERLKDHEKRVKKYEALVAAGYGEYETDPGVYTVWPVEKFDKFIEDYQFKVIPVSAA